MAFNMSMFVLLHLNNMKKDNSSSSQLNNFHLQLYALQEEQSTLNKQATARELSFLYKVEYFPISISMTSAIIYFSFFLIWIVQLFDSYLTTYSIVYKQGAMPLLQMITSFMFGMNFVGYIINWLLLFVIVVAFFFHYQETNQGFFYFFWYFGSKTYPYLRYLIECLLLLTSYFAIYADSLSLVLFSIAALISCCYTVFLQNITLRKDQFCCKSLEFCFLFKVTLIISMIVNIISLNQVFTTAELVGCIFGHLILATNMVICYFSFGLTIYRHKVGRYSCFFLVTTYFSLSLSFLIDVIATKYYSYTSSNIFLIFFVIFFILEFFLIAFIERMKRQSNHPLYDNLKNKIYFSFNKYEQADDDQEIDCEIRGILHDHYTRGCRNLECIANIKEVYDSKKKKKCSIEKLSQGKVSVIKFYVKCLYEEAIKEDHQNINLQIDYIEFYYLKLKNIFTVLRKITQIQLHYLTFYQKLRLTRIKEYLTTQSNEFSRDLYNKSLSICQLINSQQIFLKIQKLISVVVQRNQLFWRYLSFNQVHLKEIMKIVQPNFKLLDQISAEWGKISHYFNINRRWKFYNICFTIFVKNEKIKPSMIEDFGNSVEYDSIFKTGNYFVDKTTEKEQLFNPIMLFQQNTCFIHAKCDQQKMIITKVSNFFQRNFDYDPKEIINSSINVLMPPSIIKFHHSMFLHWIKDGKSNNQAQYTIQKIYPLTKRGYLYPCFKFYKRYIQMTGDIDYIVMLKSNKQDQQLILINEDFQIEGITLSLHHKLKLKTGDYLYLKGINILAIMPMLIKYTKYQAFITEKDEDFLENDDNRNYFKRQGTLLKGKEDEAAETDILHQRKILNLTNVKLYLPNDFQSTLEHYKQLTIVKKLAPFEAIRELYSWLRKDKNFSKFKAEICIREKQIQSSRYYQIQINQLQENNRLEKLKLSEMQMQNNESFDDGSRQIDENRLNQIDMQLFFSMSKKKNKVILFPSKNIFLKDENNRALTQIGHINNINIFIRMSLFIFLSLVLAQLLIQMNMVITFDTLTNQYFQVSRYQKTTFMLNTQYNIQHIQPGNSWEESFVIIAYTHNLIQNYESSYFQALLYNSNLNKHSDYPPYHKIMPTNLTANRKQQTLDEFAIFFKIYQCAISLHRTAEELPQDTLDIWEYYEFNNYVYSFHLKAEQIKDEIELSFKNNYNSLRRIDIIFGIVTGIIVVGCLLFSVSRLWKVSNGFKELASILIQIDSNDMRDIIKYVDYTKYLFDHLNEKNQRMGLQNETQYSSTSGNFRSFEKKSSEISEEQQLRLATTSANLNKKIKKIEIGQEITKMIMKPAIVLLVTIIFIGSILISLNIFSITSLDSFAAYEQIGFTFMDNNSINNIIASGTIEKYRGSFLYSYQKYEQYLNASLNMQALNKNIQLTLGSSRLQKHLKILFYDNFCFEMGDVFNQTLQFQFDTICDSTNANWCSHIFADLSQQGFKRRCTNMQKGQLLKGLEIYDNFFIQQVVPFFQNQANLTLQNIVEINDAYKIVDNIIFYLMMEWNSESMQMIANRQSTISIIVVCVFLTTILFSITCIEYLVKGSLNEKYEIFRLMHEHYIPEWIIVKEKIIKVKLIKEGFMKE